MKESYSIPLTGRVAGGTDLEFIEAEMSAKYDIPLALVWYTLNGQKQLTGLRLDLDKQVFIDHFEGAAEKQKTLERAAPEIVKVIGAASRVSPGHVETRGLGGEVKDLQGRADISPSETDQHGDATGHASQAQPSATQVDAKEHPPAESERSREKSKGTLLLADNNTEFLMTRKEFVESHGYRVITATSPREVRHVLQNQHIDLAILDVRLEDDNDENDMSGLVLAREVAPSVPKILESSFITVELVREAFKPNSLGHPAAEDFVYKNDGGSALVDSLQETLG